jgi:membrane-associated phospholipid phosphatase
MELLYRQAEIANIAALQSQEWLWQGYTLAEVDPVGISAFPSLHLGIAATCACLGFAASRVVGWLATAFTLGILAGSVHLGWHYAIDGIAGIALAIVFWRISARVTNWWLARTEPEHAVVAADQPVAVN